MPVMIPDIDPSTIANEGERVVYQALKEQLPADWVVRHNLVFCRKRGRKLTPDGQVDFVVVVPGQGLLFLEVKGIKDATFFAEGGQCYWSQRNGMRMPTDDPFAQAQANKHDAIAFIRQDLGMGEHFQGKFGHVVVFPFAGDRGVLPVSHEPQVVWLFSDMSRLEAACVEALALFGESWIAQQFTADVQRRVCDWLHDRIELVPVKAADSVGDDRTIQALTREQFEAVAGALDNQRVRVEGVAGSGKTLIALWTAQALADAGQKVLLLCFNKALAAWLSDQAAGSSATIQHFHAFALNLCRSAGVSCAGDQNDALFWTETVPIQLMDAIERLKDRACYDVVLVDEAQDFHANWWPPVGMLLKDGSSRLHMFLDPEQQGVYGQGKAYPCTGSSYKLRFNCRNTQRIAASSGLVLSQAIASKPGMPVGVLPDVLSAEPTVERRVQQLNTLVNRLTSEGYVPGDIALLSPWSRDNEKCSLRKVGRINNVPLQDDVAAWRGGRCIWASTIKAFKGLEAKCVVLTDVPPYCEPAFSRTDLYVAVTRAKHRLWCIPMSVEARTVLMNVCGNCA
jgi:hypothetical protein